MTNSRHLVETTECTLIDCSREEVSGHRLYCTVVLDVSGLLLGLVHRDPVDLHSDQRIHDGAFFDVDFGQLLTADHLKHTRCSLKPCKAQNYVLRGPYLYGEDHRLVAVPLLGYLRVESLLALSHETGLQDVATAAVQTKQSVVQIHPLPGCLEVQRN